MKKENSRYDIRCTRCGKHLNELTAFDIEIQSKVDICIEGKLLKQFREVQLVERIAEYDEILQRYATSRNIIDLKNVYGESKVQAALEYDSWFKRVNNAKKAEIKELKEVAYTSVQLKN